MTTAAVHTGARVAGRALAVTLGLVAAVTHGKPLHAKGRTHRAVLRIDAPVVGSGVRLLSERGQHDCIARMSRAMSTPEGFWDIGGFALRVESAGPGCEPADLLFASTGTGRIGRHLLRMTRHPMSEPMTTLLPLRAGTRSLLLLVQPLDPRARQVELSVGLDGGAWSRVGIIEVGPEMRGASPRFDPLVRQLEGTVAPPWVTAIREPAYRTARRLGRRTH
ncbi:phosphodiesterase [Intrasporangium sp.]|uniref:phosphodiesterase n=1 Tax=Intrasporangium sp. TaxID=1925024 RepID=UPI00293A9C53|nr:phosphodiesterase [Intrasporangium sp.]MDV3220409.1 phosphodiesterase [Intrasporangium sp.]